jgi:DNA-binding GntR family transcriptional regulator
MQSRAGRGGPPRYAQLATALREEIISGRLPPGSRFPSGPEIESTYEVSHYTAERAVNMLAAEGLITRRPGAGTWVAAALSLTEVIVSAGTRIRARNPRDGEAGRPGVPLLIVERPGQQAEPFPADTTVVIVS